jgi:serine/threonine protein kinase
VVSIRLDNGAVIGAYQIDGLLAEGGMGVVYRARQVALDLPVALKVIRPEWAHDDDFRARFKREARLAASLHHPNVVSPHDFGDHEGQLFVVMPLIPGTDLGSVIEQEGPLPPARATDLIGQIAGALDVAHASGLVHRDVKPANVLLVRRDGHEHAYLTDFGVAKAMSSETKITRLGQLPGTPGYVSPEQINGDPLTARTDVYSLGCVLCEALTGTVPYPRQTPAAMLIAHMTDAPPRISERVPDAPAGFDEVVSRALAKDPAQRFASAGELAVAAEAAARTTGASLRAAHQAERPVPQPESRTPPEPDHRPQLEPESTAAEPVPQVEASGPPAAAPEPVAVPQSAGSSRPPSAAAGMSAGRTAALVVPAAAVGGLLSAVAGWNVGQKAAFDVSSYGDRAPPFVAGGLVFAAVIALAVAIAWRRHGAAAVMAAVCGALAGAAGGLLAAGVDYSFDKPRRWLAVVWAITGAVGGIGATALGRDRQTILLAGVLGALGGGVGAVVARNFVNADEVLGGDGFARLAVAEVIAGTAVGCGIGVALALVALRPRRTG